MNQGRPRCLLLDLGMVLVSLNYRHLAEKMQALTKLDPAYLQAVLIADSLVQRFETGKLTGTLFYEEVCRRIGIRISWQEFLDAWNSLIGQPLVPDHLLAALARNHRLWIISNTNELHFDYLARHFAFLRHFEGFILSFEVGELKPDSRIFLHALKTMRSHASEVLYVDDQEANVKAAQDLGINAFRFLSTEQFSAELQSRGLVSPDS